MTNSSMWTNFEWILDGDGLLVEFHRNGNGSPFLCVLGASVGFRSFLATCRDGRWKEELHREPS